MKNHETEQTEEKNPVENPLTYKTPGEIEREEDERLDEENQKIESENERNIN